MVLASPPVLSPNANHRDQTREGTLTKKVGCTQPGSGSSGELWGQTAQWGGGTGRGLHCGRLTPTVAEPPELVLLAGGHDEVVQGAEPGQAVDGEAAVVGHQGQRVPLQHQQPQALQGAETGHHALQVRQVVEAQVQRNEVGPRRWAGPSGRPEAGGPTAAASGREGAAAEARVGHSAPHDSHALGTHVRPTSGRTSRLYCPLSL